MLIAEAVATGAVGWLGGPRSQSACQGLLAGGFLGLGFLGRRREVMVVRRITARSMCMIIDMPGVHHHAHGEHVPCAVGCHGRHFVHVPRVRQEAHWLWRIVG